MGRSTFALLAFFSIFLFACITEARKNLDDAQASNEKTFMKDFNSKNPNRLFYQRSAADHDGNEGKDEEKLMKDFDSKNPNRLIYQRFAAGHDGTKENDEEKLMKDLVKYQHSAADHDGTEGKDKEKLMKDFDSKNPNFLNRYASKQEKA